MKLLFGKNGVGKTLYSQQLEKKSAIVLTSRLDEWKSGNKISQFAKLLEKNSENLDKLKGKFGSAGSRKDIGYQGSATNFKNMMSKNKVYEGMFTDLDILNSIRSIDDLNEIPAIGVLHTLNDYSEEIFLYVQSLSKEDFDNVLGATKLFNSIKKKAVEGTEKFISDLNEIKNNAEKYIDGLENDFIKGLIKDGNIDILNQLRDSKKLGSEIIENIKLRICENIKSLWGSKILELLEERNSLSNSKMTFNIQSEYINSLKSKYNVELELTDDGKSIEVKDGGLSSGQFTTLLTAIILNSVSKSTSVILDDVLETLDYDNRFSIISVLINYEKSLVLTHDLSVVKDVESIAEAEYVDVNIENFAVNGLSLVSSGSKPHTWRKLMNEFRNVGPTTTQDFKVVRQIIKLIARYIAKQALMHTEKGYASKKVLESSVIYEHWIMSAKLFHYDKSIDFTNINELFPYLGLTSNISSLDFIDALISKLNSVTSTAINSVKISKLIDFLEKIKVEVKIEETLYDGRESSNGDAQSYIWGGSTNAYNMYNKLREKTKTRKRNISLIHSIDTSPEQLI